MEKLGRNGHGGHVKAPAEIVFAVTEPAEGGFDDRALGCSIFTQADDWADLRAIVKGAVICHFGDKSIFTVVKLRFVRDEAPYNPDEAVDTRVTEREVNG